MTQHRYQSGRHITIDYTVSEDNRFLFSEARSTDSNWKNCTLLKELNPDYKIYTSSGHKERQSAICNALLGAFFLLVTASYGFGSLPVHKALEKNPESLLFLAVGCCFILLAPYFLWKRRNARFCCVVFSNNFSDATCRIFFPYETKPETSPFLCELQRTIARQFVIRKPSLETPDHQKLLHEAFDQLVENQALTPDELFDLNKKVFGGTVVRNNIGFAVNE